MYLLVLLMLMLMLLPMLYLRDIASVAVRRREGEAARESDAAMAADYGPIGALPPAALAEVAGADHPALTIARLVAAGANRLAVRVLRAEVESVA